MKIKKKCEHFGNCHITKVEHINAWKNGYS